VNKSEKLFLDGVTLFKDQLLWDAIEAFEDSIANGLKESLIDDCYLNIAICYMQLNLFKEAEGFFKKVLLVAESGNDHVDTEGLISGKTSSRAILGLIRINIADNDIEKARENLMALEEDEQSHMTVDGKTKTLHEVAKEEIENFKS